MASTYNSFYFIIYIINKYEKKQSNPIAKAIKTKTGKKICRWVQLPNNKKSIMPRED